MGELPSDELACTFKRTLMILSHRRDEALLLPCSLKTEPGTGWPAPPPAPCNRAVSRRSRSGGRLTQTREAMARRSRPIAIARSWNQQPGSMQCVVATTPAALAGRPVQRAAIRSSVQPLQHRRMECRASAREVRRRESAAATRQPGAPRRRRRRPPSPGCS